MGNEMVVVGKPSERRVKAIKSFLAGIMDDTVTGKIIWKAIPDTETTFIIGHTAENNGCSFTVMYEIQTENYIPRFEIRGKKIKTTELVREETKSMFVDEQIVLGTDLSDFVKIMRGMIKFLDENKPFPDSQRIEKTQKLFPL